MKGKSRNFWKQSKRSLKVKIPLLGDKEDEDNGSSAALQSLMDEQKILHGKISALTKSMKQSKEEEAVSALVTTGDQRSLLRLKLKISGTIGQPGETNKLNFISLVHQIEGAISKGYSDVEVREAVIKAISSGMTLRNFLEGTPGLSLPKLRKILRSHYKEKSATELYKALSTLAQAPNEDAQTFLFRALELRQRVIFTSKEVDSKIQYDPRMIQNLFLHSLETGLRDESIRSKLRPFLQDPTIPDEDLIGQMNVIFSEEQEREVKFGKRPQKIATGRLEQITPTTSIQGACKQICEN